MSTELDAELTGSDPTEVVGELLQEADADSEYYLVDPPWQYVSALAEAGTEFDESELPTLQLVAQRETLVSLRQSFVAASRAANLVEAGTLGVRERNGGGDTPTIVGDERVYAPLLMDGTGAAIAARSGSYVEHAADAATEVWESGESFSLRTPALDRLRSTMETDLGETVRADFDNGLSTVAGQRDSESFEAVTAAVVVAAANDILHYDLSRWGEEVGLASKATFSRRKGELEDLDVVTTEKVPVEMGRPRQRLQLTNEYREMLAEHGVDELVARLAG